MGEIADEIIERMIGEYREYRPRGTYQSGSGARCWRTASGQVLPMESMTTEHLQNALRMCERQRNSGKAKDIRAVLRERAALEARHD